MKPVGTILYYLFTTTAVLFALLLAASLFPITGNFKVKIVLSGSMEPSLPIGSLIFLKPEASYAIGDVVTFGKDTKTDIPTTHRIIAVRGEPTGKIFQTKGDANENEDTRETRESEVLGRVFLHIPYLGYVLDFAKKPIGFIFLIIVPALVIILDEVGNIWREARKIRIRNKELGIRPGVDQDSHDS